jgi:hypothetical protein
LKFKILIISFLTFTIIGISNLVNFSIYIENKNNESNILNVSVVEDYELKFKTNGDYNFDFKIMPYNVQRNSLDVKFSISDDNLLFENIFTLQKNERKKVASLNNDINIYIKAFDIDLFEKGEKIYKNEVFINYYGNPLKNNAFDFGLNYNDLFNIKGIYENDKTSLGIGLYYNEVLIMAKINDKRFSIDLEDEVKIKDISLYAKFTPVYYEEDKFNFIKNFYFKSKLNLFKYVNLGGGFNIQADYFNYFINIGSQYNFEDFQFSGDIYYDIKNNDFNLSLNIGYIF